MTIFLFDHILIKPYYHLDHILIRSYYHYTIFSLNHAVMWPSYPMTIIIKPYSHYPTFSLDHILIKPSSRPHYSYLTSDPVICIQSLRTLHYFAKTASCSSSNENHTTTTWSPPPPPTFWLLSLWPAGIRFPDMLNASGVESDFFSQDLSFLVR